MYAKCWDLTNARVIFERMLQRNESCWNAMISGFACHGHCKEGFVMDGLEIFSKIDKYGLTASIKHYSCLVNLLGRAGRLREAYDLVNKMLVKPNGTIWGALLGACRIHSDIDMTNQVLENVSRQGSSDDSHYLLMSNIY